jgi:flagellar biosynthetic protein FliP
MRRARANILCLIVLLPAVAAAQPLDSTDAATPATRPAGSMPEMGDLLRLADKATAPVTATDGAEGDPDAAEEGGDWATPIRLAIVFAVLAILPSILVMTTSFTRIVIVLSFIRRALTTQTIPPNVALIGLALFLTIFTMSPTLGDINTAAIQPYIADEIDFPTAIGRANDQLKQFMLRQTREADLALFVDLAGTETPETVEEVPVHVAIPAFAISEFRTAFEMGFLLFVPFLLVDLVIAGILLSAGMMMLPPIIISLPFKIILFVLVDGWQLLARSLVSSFY